MSPPGRPKGEFRSAQREGTPVGPSGPPKASTPSAPREGAAASAAGLPAPPDVGGTPAPADLSVEQAFAAAYQELRRLARARLRGGGRNTVLDTTALVHETYLKLSRMAGVAFPDRPRFLVYAGRAMRSIIVDMVRQRQTERAGGDVALLTLTGDLVDAVPAEEEHILRVHEALAEMAQVDERMARVVEMRYFGGMTETEIGEALGVTDRTVRRDWEQARLFLAEALK
ncbi:MAG: sigma-70 family RNA polymerase sigma factor [Rubrivivax sp.]|nr:sigma-70 family RNA polymerase sigma factor [Rubrivivax sp.]